MNHHLFCEEHKAKEIKGVCLDERNQKILLCTTCLIEGKQRSFKVIAIDQYKKDAKQKSNKRIQNIMQNFNQYRKSFDEQTKKISQVTDEVERNTIAVKNCNLSALTKS